MTELAPLELATGIVFGTGRIALGRATALPAAALEAAVRPAVLRGPCFVSFSGGRDSSAVLATATAVARREGAPDPIPLTLRVRDVPQSHESEWQERVVGHLGLADWTRVEITDELDCVGPYARRVLERHGLLWPFNAHFHLPLLELAEGGTLLTGVGGDELWMSSHAVRERRRRRALRMAPFAVRRTVLARRQPIDFPWLSPAGRRTAMLAAGAEAARSPATLRRRMAFSRGMRYMAVGTAALDRLAAGARAEIHHPLLDLGLWAAVADAAPRGGFARRDDALAAVAGARLPSELVARRTKAGFDAAFFGEHARAFANGWDGRGLANDLIDGEALRAHWCASETPDPHTLTALQAAWLASAGHRVEEPVGGLGQ